jgi:hypothetical protein
MSYRYYVAKRNPLASWILDSTVPFVENINSGFTGDKKTGTSNPTKSTALVSCAAYSSVFSSSSIGQFQMGLFTQGNETNSWAIEAWVLPIPKTTTGPQQILSHLNIFDGLSINGKVISFSTQYLTAPAATVTFDLQEYQMAHVVGTHTKDQNQLWVNNVMVASVNLTDAQKADQFVATDGYLYSGYTTSTQQIAMNGVAFYTAIDSDTINQNYLAGTRATPQAAVGPQLNGLCLNMSGDVGNIFASRVWQQRADWSLGLKNNVEYGDSQITPTYVAGVSVAGTWTTALPLDSQGDTSIYGVLVQWTGNSITVATSLDGTTWTTATSGQLISTITSGYNPTGKDLQIRVSFAGGLAADPANLDSLTVVGYRDNTFATHSTRPITVGYPAVLRSDFEPNLYRDDNGVNLHSQTLTIGVDTSTDPSVARTLEAWIKVISGSPTISVGGTLYRNGVADSTLPIGEWSCIHYVAAADIATSITIAGDCIVGQVTLYPTPLTAAQVAHLYGSYTGVPTFRIVDASIIAISEPVSPVSQYAHDWSISPAG